MIYNFSKRNINIDSTFRCPLECPKCQRQGLRRMGQKIPGEDMSFKSFKKLADYFKKIILCGQISDPIFNPNLHEMLKYAYENKVTTYINTAASQRKMPWYEKAFDVNPDARWTFGVDGLPKDSHKYRINQDGEHLYEVMKMGAKKGMNIVWQYIVFRYNEDDIETCRKMAEDNDIIFDLNISGRWTAADEYKPKNPKNYLNSNRKRDHKVFKRSSISGKMK